MHVLLTGGAGYIGSHTALALLQDNYDVTVIDDLSNGSAEALRRVERITGRAMTFVEGDLADPNTLSQCLGETDFDAVIHFAGLKAVAESLDNPTRYYRTNLASTLTLLEGMQTYSIKKLVFSSSATIYGQPQATLINEAHPVGIGITNPYGWSKLMNEQIISDVAKAWPELSVVILRYFNPVGAHSSGLIGEAPAATPNNLMPFIAQVAAGKRSHLSVFGNDYNTPDGTGVRDYIHVADLAEGHLAALQHLGSGVRAYNLGSGRGISVLQAIRAYEKSTGQTIPYEIVPRREGDVDSVIADPRLALTELKWKTKRTFEDACKDSWKWQSQNPEGYKASY